MKDAYLIVVHAVNFLLLGLIGFVIFGLSVNISAPGLIPNFSAPTFGSILLLIVIWAIGYWFQIEKRQWILPIVWAPLFIIMGYFLLGTVVPYLDRLIYL